jgi:hypothetical protein
MRVLNGISPDFFSSGTAEVAVRINGTFEDPRMIGTASLNNASVSVLLGNDRWTVANLRAALRFTANQAQIDSLERNDRRRSRLGHGWRFARRVYGFCVSRQPSRRRRYGAVSA